MHTRLFNTESKWKPVHSCVSTWAVVIVIAAINITTPVVRAGEAPLARPLVNASDFTRQFKLSSEQKQQIAQISQRFQLDSQQWRRQSAAQVKELQRLRAQALAVRDAATAKKIEDELNAIIKSYNQMIRNQDAQLLAILPKDQRAQYLGARVYTQAMQRFGRVRFKADQINMIQQRGLNAGQMLADKDAMSDADFEGECNHLAGMVENEVMTPTQRQYLKQYNRQHGPDDGSDVDADDDGDDQRGGEADEGGDDGGDDNDRDD